MTDTAPITREEFESLFARVEAIEHGAVRRVEKPYSAIDRLQDRVGLPPSPERLAAWPTLEEEPVPPPPEDE